MKTFNFYKKYRLLSYNDFNFVFNKPNILSLKKIVFLRRLNKFNYSRIGILVRKKYIKQAFLRNQIKRVIRESFRLNKNKLLNFDIIVIVKEFNSNYFLKKNFKSFIEKIFK